MAQTQRIKDLFDLPESVHKIDYVEVLTDAVRHPAETSAKYVVTPALRVAFDDALTTIGNALKHQRSQAVYLHGSFGSGKSHFMALLSLMLEPHEAVWRQPELHPLRAKHAYVGGTRFLQLALHLVNKRNLEEALFGLYVSTVRERHPSAPVPGLFADVQLFADAHKLLDELGDAAFFAPLNPASAADADWGQLPAGERWDRARFEAAMRSDVAAERAALYSALVTTRYSAHASASHSYVELDQGLAVMAAHARSLGYQGIVLFLDEIILWLASRAADVAWFHNEVQKLVKLVEAQDSHRDIPIISFLPRQRDLAEVVGEDYAGIENALLRDSLKWSELRFEKIKLEDRNLPVIVERRILKPKDEAARATLDQAFERVKSGASSSWQTLLGQLDAQAFRQLYPFSPALVDALVALSNTLQRERTALRLLTEILVEHAEDLTLGELVGVGDLFDVLAGGSDTADGVMRARFESAKQLYQYQLLPLLQSTNGTTTSARCQRLRPEHPVRLGCSGCPEKVCRADNRLVKTLLIAALVPEVPVLKDLTAGRLAQLNHGSLRAPFGGDTASIAAQKLKSWAARVGQLHVGNQLDPTVRIQLEGVDLEPIMRAAESHDLPGSRQRVVRDVLFDAMGISGMTEQGLDDKHEWRGTLRPGHIRFGNVRRMSPEQLSCPEGHAWRVVVDYPFDDKGFGPRDDERVVEQFRDTGGSWTLAWLPTFFSAEMNQMLGELVILEHILSTPSSTREYVKHLSIDNQTRAINDLTNLRTQKKSRIRQALEQAYGLSKAREGDLDPTLSVERHIHVLKPGVTLAPALASSLADALPRNIEALLDARYPRHPRFGKRLTTKRIEELYETFQRIVDADDKRIAADRGDVEELRGTLGELGLVRATEGAVHLLEDRTLQELERRRQQAAIERPEVGEVRRWVDDTGKMGLEPEVVDLVVRCYARWAARTLLAGDRPYEAKAGRPLPDQVVLDKPDLPSAADWARAIMLADQLFGVALVGIKALHADNLKKLEAALTAAVAARAGALTKVPPLLRSRLAELGVEGVADRLVTAASADALIAQLQDKRGKALVEALAGFEPKTSAKSLGVFVREVSSVLATLENKLVFGVFRQLEAQKTTHLGAAELIEQASSALRQDELNVGLAKRFDQLAEAGQALLAPREPPPSAPPAARPKKRGLRSLLHKEVEAVGSGSAESIGRAVTEALTTVEPALRDRVRVVARLELLLAEEDQ